MDLSVKIGSLTLKNPLILSSAGYTANAAGIQKFVQRGFGAVVCKTVTREPKEGAPAPRIFWYDPDKKTMLSGAEALRNPGAEKMAEAISESRKLADENNCLIVGSLSGNSIEEMVEIAEMLWKAGAHVIEIDMACPSTGPHLGPGYDRLGMYWAETTERAIEVIGAVRSAIDVPLWIKAPLGKILSPEWLKGLEGDAAPEALSYVGGRIPCLVINTDTGEPLLPGNLRLKMEKGYPITPMVTGPVGPSTVFHTSYAVQLTDIPLIPTGGLETGNDIIQAIMAGAYATGICKAIYRDQKASFEILSEIEAYCRDKNVKDISDLRGVVLKHLPAPPLYRPQMVW